MPAVREDVGRKTGLTGTGPYLTTVLELDCFFLNEDRHTNNLAVIRNEESKDQGVLKCGQK